ncbi:MAG: DUF1501 domain-containing protein [Planctomycetaceae bacterium]|nr:DUF1501 domain-containing protein [Planctomycetaceae bacterium]
MIEFDGRLVGKSPLWTRRDCLRAGFLGLGGLTLADLLRERAATAGETGKAETSVILLFVHGGPSHLETYDMKPEAPDDIRGPFAPIRTNVAGIDVCEHLPMHAKTAHRFTLIRSCHHDQSNHFEGHARFLSGYGQFKTGTSESHYPMVGAVANRALGGIRRGMPAAVAINGVVLNGPDYSPGIAQGFWSAQYRVPICNGGLRDASLTVGTRQLEDRMRLLKSFDKLRSGLDVAGSMDALDVFNQRAVEILTTDRARRAFDLTLEDPRVRARYGDGYGQEALLARRLVEAGVGFVSVRIPGGSSLSKAYDWDDHAVNWDMRTAMLGRLPKYDQVVTALINDIHDRGLDKQVLVVVTGEFGRTPRLEHRDGRIGRDHYPAAMSILVAGGGTVPGRVIGQTNRYAEHPKERPLDPHDILATIYRHLGIDHRREYLDPQGRPLPLTRGEPIAELF